MNSEKTASSSYINFFISAIGIVVFGSILKELQSIFIPFTIAYIMYFAFAPFNNWLYSKKLPLALIIILDIILIIGLFYGISTFFIQSWDAFNNDLAGYETKLNTIVRGIAQTYGLKDPSLQNFSVRSFLAKIDYKAVFSNAFGQFSALAGTVFLTILFFAFIVGGHHGIYMAIKRRFSGKSSLKDKEDDAAYFPKTDDETPAELSPSKTTYTVKLDSTVNEITTQIQQYIIAKILVNATAGVLVGVALWILGVDFYILWGAFVFLFNFIPTIGAVAALGLPALMSLVQSGKLGFMFLVIGVIAALQTLVFNILEPLIVGKRLGLNPIVILLAVLIWGYIWGIIGMLLAVPLTAIIKISFSRSKNPNVMFIVDLMNQD